MDSEVQEVYQELLHVSVGELGPVKFEEDDRNGKLVHLSECEDLATNLVKEALQSRRGNAVEGWSKGSREA